MKLYSKIFRKTVLKKNKYSDLTESLNGNQVVILSTRIHFFDANEKLIFSSELDPLEEDDFTKTYQGQFADGTKFRVIQPHKASIENIRREYDCEGAFSIASIDPQGFAIHFLLVKTPSFPINVAESDVKDQVYKLIDASILAYTFGAPEKIDELVGRMLQLDPNQEIIQTHPEFAKFIGILNKLV